MMKRISLLIILVWSVFAAVAATYDVADVPNVHVADRTRYVSNPDGILSAETESQLNRTLQSVWDQTSAEMVVVVIDNIPDNTDIDRYATDLFTAWGIGKKDKDNGLLVLIVKDQRKAAIRTGYGMEGTVPDILGGQVIRHAMAPRFREGDYDGGTIEAVNQLAAAVTSPDAREELMSKYANDADARGSGSEADELFKAFLAWGVVLTLIALLWLITEAYSTRKMERFERYQKLDKLSTPMLIITFLALGAPLIAYIPLRLLLHKLRREKRRCPNCNHKMTLVDEEHDNNYLTPAQDTEERINSVDYDVWLCPQCGETDILPYVNKTTTYTVCPVCHARACTLRCDRIVAQPTTTREGFGIKEYECMNCHNRTQKRYNIAKLVAPPVIISGGGFRGGGGGGFSGGSFGGGMTGGGGASGGW